MKNTVGKPIIPSGITCPDWEPIDLTKPTKLCRYYLKPTGDEIRGLCELPKNFSCLEWDKANPSHVRTPPQPTRPPSDPSPLASGPEGARQGTFPVYLGPPAPETAGGSKTAKREPRRLPLHALPEVATSDLLVSITQEQVQQLEETGLEVQLTSESPLIGEVWLVPQRTQKDRTELTFQDCATLRMIADILPGSRVVAIQKAEKEE